VLGDGTDAFRVDQHLIQVILSRGQRVRGVITSATAGHYTRWRLVEATESVMNVVVRVLLVARLNLQIGIY